MATPRITYPSACVLQALAKGASYGFDIMDFTGLPSGTVYPILRRIEEHCLVRSKWEAERYALLDGRPRRRNYELTAAGKRVLATAIQRFALQRHLFEEAAESHP